MGKILFVVFCWVIIMFNVYAAGQSLKLINNNDIKLLANVIFYSAGAIIVTLAFIAEYLRKIHN